MGVSKSEMGDALHATEESFIFTGFNVHFVKDQCILILFDPFFFYYTSPTEPNSFQSTSKSQLQLARQITAQIAIRNCFSMLQLPKQTLFSRWQWI